MNTKKMISKLVLLLMISTIIVNSMATTAKAAVVNNIGSITVNKIEKGVTLTAYQIMDENFDFTVLQLKEPMYSWCDEVASWVADNYAEFIDVENLNAVTSNFSESTDVEIAEFYDKLSVAIKKGTVAPQSQSLVSDAETATFDSVLIGNHLILIENGVRIYRPLTANVLHEWDDEWSEWTIISPTVDAKSTAPTVSKTVTEGLEKDNFSIGDTVSFELNAIIPSYPDNAIAKEFVVSDALPESLTLRTDSIKTYGVNEGEDPVLLSGAYTKTSTRPTGTEGEKTVTFALNFVYEKIAEYSSVRITYDAVLNEKAVIGVDGNINNAYLDYNNNPYIENTWKSDDDSAAVYTYGLEVLKIDEETKEPLSGAMFYLSKDGKRIKFVNENGVYRVAKTDETGSSELDVNDQGMLYIHGLDAGIYELEEEYAPNGYVKLQYPIEVVIADDDLDGNVESDEEELEDGMMTVTVKNGKGFMLPVTGGMGTLLFSVTGILMMSAGIILTFVFFRRNEKK